MTVHGLALCQAAHGLFFSTWTHGLLAMRVLAMGVVAVSALTTYPSR